MTAFGMGFGNPTTSAPTFGTGSAFGTMPTATQGTGLSFGFNAPAATTAATGFSFGQPATTTQSSAFSFGAPATTAPSAFSFGPTTTSAPSAFSFGTTTTSAPSAFSFGPTTSAPSAFSFGATTTAPPAFSFGNIGTTSTAPTFSFGNFGAATSTTPSGFSFGQPTAFGTGGGFGAGAGMGTGTAVAAGVGTQLVDALTNVAAAVNCPIVYGDERDAIIAKWNQLQAAWGTGKGYFLSNAPPVDFTPDNLFGHLKAVGYSCIPTAKPEAGLVSLIFNKKEEDLRSHQQQVVDSMQCCFGNRPNISVCIDAIKGLPENKSEVVIFLMEKTATGVIQRIQPTEICAYLEQPNVKSNLGTLGITNVYPKTELTREQLQHYLDNPPPGFPSAMWEQARVDNPCPDKLIPVPLIGFDDLHRRMKFQEYETKQHQERLDIIADDIAELSRRHTTTVAKIAENKRKLIEIQHRVLKMLVQQEIIRKMGFSIQADEEQLRIKLEAIQAELSAPTQFKGHLRELISQIRLQNYQGSSGAGGEHYTMDAAAKEKIKDHLHLQQEGITHLISIIKEDIMDLKTIEQFSKNVAERKL